MNNKDLKITLSQCNTIIGDFDEVLNKISTSVKKAKSDNSDIIVFPELFITAYSPLDKLEQADFLDKTQKTLEKAKELSMDIGIIIGAPSINESKKGKALYNSAFFLYKKKLIHISNKGLIPNYDIFDEYRYFEPASEFNIVEFKGHRIALTICEDLWDTSKKLEYKMSPLEILAKQNPSIIINIAASPYDYLKHDTRKDILTNKAKQTKLPLIYVNFVGAQSEFIFDGGSMAITSTGEIFEQLSFFKEDIKTISVKDLTKSSSIPKSISTLSNIESIHEALVLGIKDFFSKSGFASAVIGLSGGIDSAIVTVLATEALGNKNVNCVFLPTAYSSKESLIDAKQLAENLKTNFDIINIEKTYRGILNILPKKFKEKGEDITEENIQSRLRGLLLMAYTNKFRFILLNTSNKSEMATGYGTLYGDMCGSLSVVGDLYKTQIYELCKHINREKEIIPINIIEKEPTAELKPNQKDIDTLPPYEILDKILFNFIELGKTTKSISENFDIDIKLVEKIISMLNKNEFKRFQSPPILRVSSKAFGVGRRIPLVSK